MRVKDNLKSPKFAVTNRVCLAVQDEFEKVPLSTEAIECILYYTKNVLNTILRTFTVQDEQGKQHRGTFYDQELQANPDQHFRIEKVIKYKSEKGKRYGLVKWIEYDNSYYSWEPADELRLIQDRSDRILPEKQDHKK